MTWLVSPGSGLLRRTDHPDDSRAFRLELTEQGADLVVDAAAVVRRLYDRLLAPIGGRTGRRAIALMGVLETLLEQAEGLDQARGAHAADGGAPPPPRKPRRPS